MFGRGFPTQRRGEAIRASTINAGLRAAAGLLKLRVGPGLALKWLGDTPLIELTAPLGGLIARSDSGGVPGRVGTTCGKADVRIHNLGPEGELVDTGVDVVAYNLATVSVGPDAYLMLKPLRSGRLVVDWEQCPS